MRSAPLACVARRLGRLGSEAGGALEVQVSHLSAAVWLGGGEERPRQLPAPPRTPRLHRAPDVSALNPSPNLLREMLSGLRARSFLTAFSPQTCPDCRQPLPASRSCRSAGPAAKAPSPGKPQAAACPGPGGAGRRAAAGRPAGAAWNLSEWGQRDPLPAASLHGEEPQVPAGQRSAKAARRSRWPRGREPVGAEGSSCVPAPGLPWCCCRGTGSS